MPRGPWKPTNGIKWHRLRLGLTQAALAARIGIDQAHIAEWERWQRTPTPERQAQLAEVLGCPVGDLLEVADIDMEVFMLRVEAGKKRRGRWPKWKGLAVNNS